MTKIGGTLRNISKTRQKSKNAQMTNKIKGNLLSMQCPKSLVAKKNIELELFASHRAVRHEKWNISRNE